MSEATGLQVASLKRLSPPEARVTVPAPKKPAKHPVEVLPATMLLVRLSEALAGVNVPTKMAASAQGGATFPLIVELTICMPPSVWKMAPPYQACAVFPLRVLLIIFTFPRLRSAPPTPAAVLPLIVLLRIVTAALKKAYTPPPSTIWVLLLVTVLLVRFKTLSWPL